MGWTRHAIFMEVHSIVQLDQLERELEALGMDVMLFGTGRCCGQWHTICRASVACLPPTLLLPPRLATWADTEPCSSTWPLIATVSYVWEVWRGEHD